MPNRERATPGVLLLLPVAIAVACSSEEPTCGPGTRFEDGRCVAVCDAGTEPDPKGRCVATCVAGTHRDESGLCLPDAASCTSGSVWDGATNRCVDVDALCGEESTWVASEARCVPDRLLRVADRTEGEAENDPHWGGPEAVERFELPAIGASIRIAGGIDEPIDRNADHVLDPDWDLWVFEADGPALLRIEADALGGATSGFQVLRLDGAWYSRLAVGMTDRVARRDLFVPQAGVYALVATDGLNFLASRYGPYVGGEDSGYFIEIRRLALPEPKPLSLAAGVASAQGLLPLDPPEEGSAVAFFRMQLPGRTTYLFDLWTGWFSLGSVVLVGSDGLVHHAASGLTGLVADDDVLVAVDLEYTFEIEDMDFELQVVSIPTLWIDPDLDVTVEQPAWAAGRPLPYLLLGLEAGAGEILSLDVASSTGFTCIELYDGHYARKLDAFSCHATPGAAPVHEGELRILAPHDGFYGLTAVDWAGATLNDAGYLTEIPAKDYGLGLAVHREIPLATDEILAPWTAEDQALADPGEIRYYRVAAPVGHAVTASITGDFDPRFTLFESGTGRLAPDVQSASRNFAFRAHARSPLLLGVEAAAAGAGPFALRLEPLPIAEVGLVAADGFTTDRLTLGAGEWRWFFRAVPSRPGLVELEVGPPAGGDFVLRRLDPSLGPVAEQAAPGGAITALAGAADLDGLFVELATADGLPLPADVEASVVARLVPAVTDGKGNVSPARSRKVTVPGVIAAALSAPEEVDWYHFDLAAPAIVTVATLPSGEHPVHDTLAMIGNAGGTAGLALDDDGGVGRHCRIELALDEPGRYTVAVRSVEAAATGTYLLEVSARAP